MSRPDHQLEREKIPRSDPEGEDHSSARDVKRARGEPEQDLSGEMQGVAVNWIFFDI